MLLLQQSLLAAVDEKKRRNMVISLFSDHFKEVQYDCEKSSEKEKRNKKGIRASEGYAVLYTSAMLAALDEWTPLKEQCLLAGNA